MRYREAALLHCRIKGTKGVDNRDLPIEENLRLR
jgi:hypothetical protein